MTEWINFREKEEAGKTKIRSKGKRVREDNDSTTLLTQEQTTLFISYLQRTKIIRYGENLKNKEAGEAFAMLTGYSAETIRQTLGQSELERISMNKKNLVGVENAIKRLTLAAKNDIDALKK
ncbi:MAG: hypothetical protein ACK40M_01645 [Flavobacteriales bacterium]